jgi:hypothetical protein
LVRRTELGAGVAAAVLSAVTLAAVMLLPLVALCPGAVRDGHCPFSVRYVSLLAAGGRVDVSVWLYVGAMMAVAVAGALGAILDGGFGWNTALPALWGGTGLAVVGCVFFSVQGSVLGPFFLPPVLALAIAAYAAYVRRARRPPRPAGERADTPGDAARTTERE